MYFKWSIKHELCWRRNSALTKAAQVSYIKHLLPLWVLVITHHRKQVSDKNLQEDETNLAGFKDHQSPPVSSHIISSSKAALCHFMDIVKAEIRGGEWKGFLGHLRRNIFSWETSWGGGGVKWRNGQTRQSRGHWLYPPRFHHHMRPNRTWVKYIIVLKYFALLNLSGLLESMKSCLLVLWLAQFHQVRSIEHRNVFESKTITNLTQVWTKHIQACLKCALTHAYTCKVFMVHMACVNHSIDNAVRDTVRYIYEMYSACTKMQMRAMFQCAYLQ